MPPTLETLPGRIFPPITPNLYTPPGGKPQSPNIDAVQRLLRLVSKKLTFRQKYLGHNLDAEARAGRLLGFHEAAMSSELAGAFARADFLWRRLHDEFAELAGRQVFWEELARAVVSETGEMSDPNELRRRLVTEVFVETHLAFYRTYAQDVEQPAPDGRAFTHFEYAKELLPWAGVSGDAFVNLLRQPLVDQMNWFHSSGQWDHALELTRLVSQFAPDHVGNQEERATIYFAMTLASLKGGAGVAARDDAETLLGTIEKLEEMRSKCPFSLRLFHLLGRLHQLRSTRLATAGVFSQALVSAQKAISFCPGDEDAERNRDELAETMKKTQAQMHETEERIAKRQAPGLSGWGQMVQAEAAKGFAPLDEYLRSPEAREIAAAYLAAQGHALRHELRLPDLPDEQGERARALLAAVEGVLNEAPSDEHKAVALWRKAAATHAELAAVDEAAARDFLRRKLFPASGNQEGARPQATAEETLPLPVAERKMWSSPEPFGYWFFSRQNLNAKMRAVAAILLLLVSGGLWGIETWARSRRDSAYLNIIEATDKHQYAEVLNGAEAFLSHLPLIGEDERRRRVVDYYNEALLRFVAQQDGGDLSPASAERVAQYRQLVSNTK